MMDKDKVLARLDTAIAINVAAIGEVTAAKLLITENGNGGGNGGGIKYWPKISKAEREKVYAVRFYPGLNMHFMGLQGWIYRNLKYDRKKTVDHVYEMFKRARMKGVRYVRTFMYNGSRDWDERYMSDAHPYITLPNGKIDFEQRNDYFFECCMVIERACKTWHMIHRPTHAMWRYNNDMFLPRNNVQGINGFNSLRAQAVRVKGAVNYCHFQKIDCKNKSTPTFEFINEPYHFSWPHGKLLADQNLEVFLAVQALGYGITHKHIMTCSGTDEFQHAHFCHRFSMMINGNLEWFGFEEIKKRWFMPDHHGCSTKESLLARGFVKLHRNLFYMRPAFNEDGGDPLGRYQPLPWSKKYMLADYEQLHEQFHYAIPFAHAKGKPHTFTIFMTDCLSKDPVDGIVKETYDLDRMNYDRVSAYGDAMQELGY